MAGPRQWVTIASEFPAGLNTEADPADLRDGFSPDVIGQNLDAEGKLATGSIVAGDAVIKRQFSIGALFYRGGTTWDWYFDRLWRMNGANLEWGAKEYQDRIFHDGLDAVSFDEDTQNLVDFFPFAGNSLFVGKSTGGYQLFEANFLRGRSFEHGNIVPQMAVTAAGRAVEFDGTAYTCNGDGLYSWAGRDVTEVTAPVRNVISTYFQNQSLLVDQNRRRIVGGSNFVFDPSLGKLFVYSGSTFRYTTPTVRRDGDEPFTVWAVGFSYVNTNESRATITVQRKVQEDWEDTRREVLPFSGGKEQFHFFKFDPPQQSRRFAMRITEMSSNIRISKIHFEIDPNVNLLGYSP